MPLSGDYIDGGPGDDCIVLEGPGDRIVIGGTGNDRTITVPAGTSDATIERIFAHCGDPAYLAGMGATTTQAEDKPVPAATHAQTEVPKSIPARSVDSTAEAWRSSARPSLRSPSSPAVLHARG